MKKQTEQEKVKASLDQMRSGMMNFLGQYISMLPFEGTERNKTLVAMLSEEILKISRPEENIPCDLYILVPLLKAVRVAIEHNIKHGSLHVLELDEKGKEQMFKYAELSLHLQELIKDLEEGKSYGNDEISQKNH